uniref:RAB7B, member RAS oncogene family n=1 Tax=Equus asinus asinus TaxID=83772 RepID=A0A8C4L9F5_EQUAS
MNPRKKVDLKLIIIGALGVGKTSLLHQYVHKTFYEDYQTTLGASILSKIIVLDDTTLKLQYQSILENYLTDSIKLSPEDQSQSRCC